MHILLLGGTGFIGSRVAQRLIPLGHDVTVLHRGRSSTEETSGVRSILADRADLAAHTSTWRAHRPDVVVDLIAYTQEHAENLVTAFRGIASRTVVISSGDVYRNYDGLRGKIDSRPDPVPLREDAPLRPNLYPYRGMEELTFEHKDEYEKILVEQAAASAPDLPATILRLPAIYGPGDVQRRMGRYVRAMVDERPHILLAEEHARWRWSRGHVENVAYAIALAATSGEATGSVYNVGETPPQSEGEWVAAIAQVVGWTGRIVTRPAATLPSTIRPPMNFEYELLMDTQRIRKELGYREPLSPAHALQDTVNWERANSMENTPEDYRQEDETINRDRY